MSASQDGNAANTSTEGNARTQEFRPLNHLTDEEWLREIQACPRLLDCLYEKSDERLLILESLRQWQEAGCPDLKSLRAGTLPAASQPLPQFGESLLHPSDSETCKKPAQESS